MSRPVAAVALMLLFGLVCWGVLCYPAYLIAGRGGLEGLTWATLLCVFPGCLAVAIGCANSTPEGLGLGFLVGMILRMFFVLGGFLAIRAWRPDLSQTEFLLWLVVIYLASLAFETWLLLRPQSRKVTTP